jgi:seryl-tRNA synthetase
MLRTARPFTCLQCQLTPHRQSPKRLYHASARLCDPSSIAPKVTVNIKHIRDNVDLYATNCIERNYGAQAGYPARIKELQDQFLTAFNDAKALRERSSKVKVRIEKPNKLVEKYGDTEEVRLLAKMSKDELLQEAKELKDKLSGFVEEDAAIHAEMNSLAVAIPNLTSGETPIGTKATVLGYIGEDLPLKLDQSKKSHVEIGQELRLLDFASASKASGWGWYYLLNEGAQLEQALVQYALSVARKQGWGVVSPPSLVYSHIAAACGFQPRDQNGEQQVYSIQQNSRDAGVKPELSLAGTAEIPLAAMEANEVIKAADLPLKRVAVSRCYRAEAGARGLDTKGLYRVHEFTKVEMFAWTKPSDQDSTAIFEEMLEIQKKILASLGLRCRILEMPSADLGASASRKIDIEAFFPSRIGQDEGWGEVTSVSTCTDYQSRRLATRIDETKEFKQLYPYTVNGTALAVPRVLAAILENGWDSVNQELKIPKCLWPYMDGTRVVKGSEERVIKDKKQSTV